MSIGGNKGGSKQQTQGTTAGTTQTSLDPAITAALAANYQRALGVANNSTYQPLTGSQIQGYENPFSSDVISTSLAQLNDQRQRALAGNNASAVQAHAFGGTGQSVQNALTNSEYDKNAGSLVSGLNAQNFQQAAGLAQSENQNRQNWPLIIQQLLNSSLGLSAGAGNRTVQTNGTSSGNTTGSNWSIDGKIAPQFTLPIPG